ncbi:hypothetical protein [Solilutibacter pythonis]|uniref:hypothetical protein n=1 Tax=Solilutibacter pythonis TaxID=2483112 RepID=UPI0011C36E7A|nr:hypothetical protein [Lysobacter pythonis]
MRIHLALMSCLALAACSSALQDEQIRGDFLALQTAGEIQPSAAMTKIVRGDGWSDGAEVRVYFCQRKESSVGKCEEENYVSLTYQRSGDEWCLISSDQE